MNSFHVIIPARFQSTRLPAKALKTIGDKPMIVHVCEQASKSGAESITVATDHHEIVNAVESAGFRAVLTKVDHPSGSDRVCEAAQLAGLSSQDIIVNVQGDEPFIPPENIALVASLVDDKTNHMGTLCCEIHTAKEALDPNAVKVVFDINNRALYFSRSIIPFNRNQVVAIDKPLSSRHFRHIGIYAYRLAFLEQFIKWSPSSLEIAESLEQLRVLENGYSIAIASLNIAPPHGVDTPADLQAARDYFARTLGD